MSAVPVRYARSGDVGDIICAWKLSFGDDEGFIRALLLGEHLIETTVVAEHGGRVVSSMTAFDGLVIGGKKASYLYALCTHPGFRSLGLGSAVVKAAIDESFRRGAQLSCLHAASPSLQRWYEAICGMEPLSYTKNISVSAQPFSGSLRRLSPEDYFLQKPHSGLTKQLLRAQKQCFSPPGGFFLLECGGVSLPFCADVRGGRLFILECGLPELAGMAAGALGFDSAVLQLPSSGGECSLLGAGVSPGFGEGLGNIFFPFVLD